MHGAPPVLIRRAPAVHSARLLSEGIMWLAIGQPPGVPANLAMPQVLENVGFVAAGGGLGSNDTVPLFAVDGQCPNPAASSAVSICCRSGMSG